MRIDPGLLTFSDPLGVGGKSTAALQRETTTLPNQCVAHFHAKPFFGFHLLARANGWVNFCGHKRVRSHERRGLCHKWHITCDRMSIVRLEHGLKRNDPAPRTRKGDKADDSRCPFHRRQEPPAGKSRTSYDKGRGPPWSACSIGLGVTIHEVYRACVVPTFMGLANRRRMSVPRPPRASVGRSVPTAVGANSPGISARRSRWPRVGKRSTAPRLGRYETSVGWRASRAKPRRPDSTRPPDDPPPATLYPERNRGHGPGADGRQKYRHKTLEMLA